MGLGELKRGRERGRKAVAWRERGTSWAEATALPVFYNVVLLFEVSLLILSKVLFSLMATVRSLCWKP